MVPSPRKCALSTTTPAFNQTWDDSDAAFLDPESLPVAKIPRGWERKKEVKKIGQGKEKKIWRRFNLRSRAENTPEERDGDVEEHDARSRPVKKQQHVSPKAMEKTTTSRHGHGKKRAFKATRWDRRKSVLPRKKSAQLEALTNDAEEESEHDESIQETSALSFDSTAEATVLVEGVSETVEHLLPVGRSRRSTFTFAMDAPTVDDLPDYESLNGEAEVDATCHDTPNRDATLTNLFRSPLRSALKPQTASPKIIDYPQLPQSDYLELEKEINTEPAHGVEESRNEVDTETASETATVHAEDQVAEFHSREIVELHHNQDMEDALTTPGTLETTVEVAYPTLPIDCSEIDSQHSGSESEGEDVEMSEPRLDLGVEEADIEGDDDSDVPRESIESFDRVPPGEEFTEASLQLDIQQQYAEALQEEEDVVTDASPPTSQPVSGAHIDEVFAATEDVTEPMVEVAEPQQSTSPSAASAIQSDSEPQPQQQDKATAQGDDITDGLTLSFTLARPASVEPTPRRLHSPPPPARFESGPEDATMTIAIDDDTAILKDFLNRAAATKAERAATHRRESIQNRRDSDVIRHALASPRKALEDKDPNSPTKYDNELNLDLSQTLTLSMPNDELNSPTLEPTNEAETTDEKSLRGSRRSSRTKNSRLPAPASVAPAQSSKIAIRRADGKDVVVLKKSNAQELATLTKANTRKNKQGAFCVSVRLLKLAVDSAGLSPIDDATKELIVGKNVRWDEQLAYYQENPETAANLLAEAESLATPDELSMPDALSDTPKAKRKATDKSSTPKVRRVRGLGTANGTPGKGLLAPTSLLPDAVQFEKEAEKSQQPPQQPPQQPHIPRPKPSKLKKMPVASTPSLDASAAPASSTDTTRLPSLDIAPVGITPTHRKSRIAAPRKVVLPQPAAGLHADGKENAQRTGLGIGDATPRKGIPAPKVVIPASNAGMESALPRRRGRKY